MPFCSSTSTSTSTGIIRVRVEYEYEYEYESSTSRERVRVRVEYESSTSTSTYVRISQFCGFVVFHTSQLGDRAGAVLFLFHTLKKYKVRSTTRNTAVVVLLIPHILTKKAQLTPPQQTAQRCAVTHVAVLSLSNLQLCRPGTWSYCAPRACFACMSSPPFPCCTMNLLAFASRGACTTPWMGLFCTPLLARA